MATPAQVSVVETKLNAQSRNPKNRNETNALTFILKEINLTCEGGRAYVDYHTMLPTVSTPRQTNGKLCSAL